MTKYSDMQMESQDEEQEVSGPEQYLAPGEELLIYATDIQIKKFQFESYLTDRRLFFVDKDEKKPGVFAKEIPVHSIVEGYLEQAPTQEPVLVLSIRTSDDDIRTMKMTFLHTGEDRTTEVEEWIHLVQHGRREVAREPQKPAEAADRTPFVAPQARDVSETIVFPAPSAREKDTPQLVKDDASAAMPEPAVPRMETPEPVQTQSSRTQIQFCHHCGRRIPPNANFCPFCGTRMHQAAHEESKIHSSDQAGEPEGKKTKEKLGWKRLFRRK